MEQQSLDKILLDKGIHPYFEAISGINNHYGGGKMEEGRHFITDNKMNPNEAYLFGDTIHDFEVGDRLGMKVVLIAQGHQSKQRLIETKAVVVDNFEQLKKWFEINGK